MKTFLKAQTSSLIATVVDFFVTVFCVELLAIPVIPSGAIGNISGAVVNFFLGRRWVFEPADNSVFLQAVKYFVVWSGYLILNVAGMWVLGNFTPFHYIVSKAIVGIVLAVTYNYFLQKKFVFN